MVFFLSLTPISRVVACWSPAPGWLVKSITLSFTAGVCSRCLLFLWAGDLVKWLVCLPSKLTHALGTKYWKNTRSSTFSGIYWPHSIADQNHKSDHKPPIQLPTLSQTLSLMNCNCGFSSNWILLYFPLFVSVLVFVTGMTSYISHIYKGITAMLIIRGPIKPYIF